MNVRRERWLAIRDDDQAFGEVDGAHHQAIAVRIELLRRPRRVRLVEQHGEDR